MSSTLNKIMGVVLALTALAFAALMVAYHAQKKQLDTLSRQNGEYRLALSGVQHQTQTDALADSLAHPGLSATIPDADVLRANRAKIRPVVADHQPATAPDSPDTEPTKPTEELPTAVILRRGEAVPYDSAVVVRYDQYYYAQRASARRRTVELATSARWPAVELPEFVPTRKDIRRGKWRAFAGGLAVGAVAALALPLVVAR